MEDGNNLEAWKLVVMILGFFATNLTIAVASWINVNVRLKAIEVDHSNTKGWIKSFSDRTDERFAKYGEKVDKLCGEIHTLVVQLAQYEGRRAKEEDERRG